MSWLPVLAAAFLLAGCAAAPPPAPAPTGAATLLELDALAGRTNSLLAAGRLSSTDALRIDGELDAARADLRRGDVAAARLVASRVQTELVR